MPGELGNESESQQVGYYEHRYKPEREVMDDDHMVQKEDPKRKETQQERLMRRWRKKLYQPKPEASGLPTGGPQPGIQ
jgi:hypothetical protein